jgi:hypothetical protein
MARSKTSPKTEKAPKPPRARRAAPSREKRPQSPTPWPRNPIPRPLANLCRHRGRGR